MNRDTTPGTAHDLPDPPDLPDLAALRHDYAMAGLDVGEVDADPTRQFERWLAEALASGLPEPTAMVVSTSDATGQPSSRLVLLKGVDERGLRFFTNTESTKGAALAANPLCAVLFPWYPLERQVRILARAEPLPADEVAEYFASRPRGSQLGAWASHQSRPVADRDELDHAWAAVEARFPDAVPVPPHWGGYRLVPTSFEFWQGRPGRMHDRVSYTPAPGGGWQIVRLAP